MKNFKLFPIVLLVSVAAVFQSCKDDDDDFKMDNQTFVTMASSSNSFEVAAGALAKERGQSQDVVHYGEHMVNDHGAVGVEMMALAQRKGWTIPGSLATKEQTNLNTLMSLSGVAFDKEFARIMVVSHQDAINLFRDAAHDGVPDDDLSDFAENKLPSLEAHLQDAVALRAKVGE